MNMEELVKDHPEFEKLLLKPESKEEDSQLSILEKYQKDI